jgi:hypothetical protein
MGKRYPPVHRHRLIELMLSSDLGLPYRLFEFDVLLIHSGLLQSHAQQSLSCKLAKFSARAECTTSVVGRADWKWTTKGEVGLPPDWTLFRQPTLQIKRCTIAITYAEFTSSSALAERVWS